MKLCGWGPRQVRPGPSIPGELEVRFGSVQWAVMIKEAQIGKTKY
jgi:hypothetical protein